MENFKVRNILDIIEDAGEKTDERGIVLAQRLIDSFACPLNQEIEHFLRHNAIDFAHKRQAITYFVLDGENRLIAYFALTHKAAQHLVGGGIVYLECEDEPHLMEFYANDANRFREFGERDSKSEGVLYKQFLRLF